MSGPGRARAEIAYDESHEQIVVSGPVMGAVFERAGDRWTHRVRLVGSGTAEIAHAVESDPERDSPVRVVSPVYQDIQHHALAGSSEQCLLLTGRWFQHHFSAAVRLYFDADLEGPLVVDFDVADRCREPVESLAATYVVALGGGALVDACTTKIEWSVSGGALGRLEMLAEPPTTLVLAEAGRQAARVQALAALGAGGFTHRLRYRWRWTAAHSQERQAEA
jgi:hypothetical protein